MRALVLASSLLSVGCLYVDGEVHPPDPRAIDVPHGIGRGREIVVELPFYDRRYEPGRCGMKKNGYNGETANVRCATPPAQFVPVLLHNALVQAGFRVLGPESKPGATTLVVSGIVGQFFVEPKIDFTVHHEADVAVRLVVTSPSGLHAERTFYVKGEDQGIALTESGMQGASDDAMRRIVSSMVLAIAQLLDRYPSLGAPAATLKPRRS